MVDTQQTKIKPIFDTLYIQNLTVRLKKDVCRFTGAFCANMDTKIRNGDE